MRRHNLRHTLQAIREHGPVTRKELIVTTGLNRVTVLDLVAELQEVGVVEELTPQSTGKSGRPARALDIDATQLAVGALELNVGYVSFALATLRGELLASQRVHIRPEGSDADSVLQMAAAILGDAVAACERAGRRLVHVTVGCIAVVDHRAGTIIKSSALGWSYVPVISELTRRLPDPPIFAIDNLANVAINAERQVRNWPADAGAVMLYGDIGVGGAYVRGSNTLRGDFESGAIFGHISVNTEGRRCFCGRRGCLETYIGIGPLANALAENPDAFSTGPEIPMAETLAAVHDAGPRVEEELHDQGRWLARAVDVLTAAFDPSVVFIGGALAQLAPLMMTGYADELSRLNPDPLFRYPQVLWSLLGPDAIIRGGIAMSVQSVIQEPWSIAPLSRQQPSAPDPEAASATTS